MQDPTQPPTSSLWRSSEFLKFWAGQTISVFGSAITGLALPLTAVLTLNATPAQMGFLTASATVPFLFVSLFAGAWIDRTRRRPIMLWADVGRAFFLALIPLGALLGWLRIEFLYFISIAVGTLSVFFDISDQAYLPTLVGREHLVEGNSKMTISYSSAEIAGPGIAGWLIQLLSAPVAIAIDAASFLVSALSLSLIRTVESPPAPAPNAEKQTLWQDIAEGLRVVFDNRLLWSIAGCTATANLFTNLFGAIFLLYLTRELHLTPLLMGIIFAAGAPGALVGALLSDKIARRFGIGAAILIGAAVSPLGGLLILLAHGSSPLDAALLAASGFLGGFGNVVYNINQVSLRQAITPNRLLGRMNASMRFLVWGTLPLGALLASALGSTLGVSTTLTLGVCCACIAPAWILLSPLPRLKEQPAPAAD